MTDVAGNPEEERRADYFYQPWCQEAVCRYFYGKVKKNHTVVSFGFVGMSEWVICQLYHGDNKLIFNEMMMRSTLY